jgi:hypothetical protein
MKMQDWFRVEGSAQCCLISSSVEFIVAYLPKKLYYAQSLIIEAIIFWCYKNDSFVLVNKMEVSFQSNFH